MQPVDALLASMNYEPQGDWAWANFMPHFDIRICAKGDMSLLGAYCFTEARKPKAGASAPERARPARAMEEIGQAQ